VTQPLRVLDTGVLEGRFNIALGQALIELHQQGDIPDTLRFLRFPPTALIGRHQVLNQEIDLDFCRENDIGLVRRITGGGAIYLDSGQLGWELVISRSSLPRKELSGLAREICEAVVDGLQRLGIAARFRPRNDIEVDGRKISGTGGFFDGDTLFFQGTVLVDMDPQRMVAALRVPRAKLQKRSLDSAAQRVVTLRELLGDDTPDLVQIQAALLAGISARFDFELVEDSISGREQRLAQEFFREEIGRDEFVAEIEEPAAARGVLTGSHTSPGGTIVTYLRLEGPAQNRVREILVTGDFFITPPRLVFDLEASLRGVFLDQIDSVIEEFFSTSPAAGLSVTAADFTAAIAAAVNTGSAVDVAADAEGKR